MSDGVYHGIMGKKPKIALFGIFGGGNFGNDASLQVMLNELRRGIPEAEIFCICAGSAQVEKDYGIRAVAIRTPDIRMEHPVGRVVKRLAASLAWRLGWLHLARLWRAWHHTRGVDFLIFPGTGLLDDFATDPWMWPFDLLAWSAMAKVNGARIMAVSIGAGPIKHPLSLWMMKKAASLCDYRSYRSEGSREFMRTAGLDVRSDAVYPDIVFGLPIECPGNQVEEAEEADAQGVIAIGIMAYYGWRNDAQEGEEIYAEYMDKLAGFVKWLLGRGYGIKVVIGEGVDERAVEDLDRLTKEAQNASGRRLQVNPMETIADLTKELRKVEAVVATRFHNVVGALMLGKPVISLGYAEKNERLMGKFGLRTFCQHVEEIDLERLEWQFEEMMRNRGKIREKIQERTKEYRQQLDEQFEILIRMVRELAKGDWGNAGERPNFLGGESGVSQVRPGLRRETELR